MSPADAAWLRMDRPTNLMVVTSVMWFDGPLVLEELRALLTERLLSRFPRFSQRVVEDHGLHWEDVEDFDPDDHLHVVRLLEERDHQALEQFASTLVSEPLAHDRPLWDIYLVDNYETGGAVVFRMHHAIADGIALARLLLSLTDDPTDDQVLVADRPPASAGLLESGLDAGMDLLLHPLRLAALADPRHLLDLARTTAADTKALARLALLPPDHRTALRGTLGTRKQVVWSEPIPLAEIREAGHRGGVTVNDVLLAAVAGALRLHLVRNRSEVHDVRAIVPFNLRPLDQPLPAELGNQFGLIFLALPLGVASREDRLREMARRTSAIKHSAEGVVSFGILQAVGMSPGKVEDAAIDLFAAKGSGVMTNVPGPREPVTLAGHQLLGTIGWGPTSGDLALGVALFSYAGSVTVGLCVDPGVIPGPGAMLADVVAEIDHLVRLHLPEAAR